MPMFDVQIDSFYYNIRAQQYLKVNQDAGPVVYYDVDEFSEDTSYYCTLRVYPISRKQWILGATFLNDFYQVYDLQRNQIGLVASKFVNSNPEQLGHIPPENVDDKLRYYICLYAPLGTIILLQLLRLVIQNSDGLKLNFHHLVSSVDGKPEDNS
jgi:hypothetical protein